MHSLYKERGASQLGDVLGFVLLLFSYLSAHANARFFVPDS